MKFITRFIASWRRERAEKALAKWIHLGLTPPDVNWFNPDQFDENDTGVIATFDDEGVVEKWADGEKIYERSQK